MLSCYRLLNYPNCPLLPLKLKIIKIKANCRLKKKNGFETDKVLPKSLSRLCRHLVLLAYRGHRLS